jgi:hypothetical protein
VKDIPLSLPFKIWIIITVCLAIVIYSYGIFSPDPYAGARSEALTAPGMYMLKHYFGLSLALELSMLYPLFKDSWLMAKPLVILMIVSSLFYILIDIGLYFNGDFTDVQTLLGSNALKLMLLVVYAVFYVRHSDAPA